LDHSIIWHDPGDVHALSSLWGHTTYALMVSLSHAVLNRPDLWQPPLREYLKHNPYTLFSAEVPGDVIPGQLDPLWRLGREHQHPVDRDYTVTHSPYRSFLVFSRADHLIWKWPDPRESDGMILPDGQRIPFHHVCCVMSPDKMIPQWLPDRLSRHYPSPPEVILWEPPEDSYE